MLTCSIDIVMASGRVITRCIPRGSESASHWKYVLVLLIRMHNFFSYPHSSIGWQAPIAIRFYSSLALFLRKPFSPERKEDPCLVNLIGKTMSPLRSVDKCAIFSCSVLIWAVKCITKKGYNFCLFLCYVFFDWGGAQSIWLYWSGRMTKTGYLRWN